MEEHATIVVEASTEYVGRWNRLISTTNWEKGRIIAEWRAAMQEADAPDGSYTDEAWSQQVGSVTPQHVGRLRRVFERFGETHDQYPGLFWSHFQATLDWPDAEMYLEGEVQSKWSVAQMHNERWEAMGGQPELKPEEADVVASDLDEDVSSADDRSLPATISESIGEVHGAGDSSEYDETDSAPFDGDSSESASTAAASDAPAAPLQRPFESLPPLPADLKEAFELMKLAILAHKVCGWGEIARDDVLSMLESLKQLALAPAEQTMTDNPLDPSGDPFGPPEISVEVDCLHCGQQYDSYLIEWRIETDAEGNQHGFWCCPTPGCGGMGFGFDILPTDPNYRDERGGWMHCDDEDGECGEFDEEDIDEDALDENLASDGPTDRTKPSGNGHGRPRLEDDWSDDIPF